MDNLAIHIQGASKNFTYAKRHGFLGLGKSTKRTIKAVDNISFTVNKGESLAFIGPNGAGKSTTIKMLCGILQPTHGRIEVLGLNPLEDRQKLAYRIGTVFGQRSQLVFNLPLTDSLKLTADMYGVPAEKVDGRIKELIQQFELETFADQPVRKLSLGQRMRAEIANSLLHNPEIVFLDEPTIGLDVVAKRSLRLLIRRINKELGTTIFLTSHDVGDIEEVCDRTIVINHGKVILDATTEQLKHEYIKNKIVRVVPANVSDTPPKINGVSGSINEDGVITYSFDTKKHELKTYMKALLDEIEIADLTIDDTPLEDIIHDLYVAEDK